MKQGNCEWSALKADFSFDSPFPLWYAGGAVKDVEVMKLWEGTTKNVGRRSL